MIDIIAYENKLLIKNFSRTTPVEYQCIADNGIPPRDTRTKRLYPSSKYRFFFYYVKYLIIGMNTPEYYDSII
jgi:hypothetical protein